MDSLTRFAQAQRAKLDLPSVRRRRPRAIRPRCSRACRAAGGARRQRHAGRRLDHRPSTPCSPRVMTRNDPIVDAARAILDGHIVLSRRIAEAGRLSRHRWSRPPVSRAMHEIIPPEHQELARRFRQQLATYEQNRDLIAIGAYQRGSDPAYIDAAIAYWLPSSSASCSRICAPAWTSQVVSRRWRASWRRAHESQAAPADGSKRVTDEKERQQARRATERKASARNSSSAKSNWASCRATRRAGQWSVTSTAARRGRRQPRRRDGGSSKHSWPSSPRRSGSRNRLLEKAKSDSEADRTHLAGRRAALADHGQGRRTSYGPGNQGPGPSRAARLR